MLYESGAPQKLGSGGFASRLELNYGGSSAMLVGPDDGLIRGSGITYGGARCISSGETLS
jgi:hypothetical protein